MNDMIFRNKLAIASCNDQSYLERGALAGLILFVSDEDGNHTTLKNVFPMIAIAVSVQGEASVRKFLKTLSNSRTIPEPPTILLKSEIVDDAAEIIRKVLDGGLNRLATFTTTLTCELAILRREREVLLENYRALEDAFRARNWEAATEVFAHDPFVDPKEEGIEDILREAGVEQLLPVSSHGVCGFALHFHKTADDCGELHVTLEYVESDESVAEWSVPFGDIKSGWNFFTLPKACDCNRRTLRLRISAFGGQPPELSLGHPISNQRYAARAQVAHGDLAHRPLAFRVFTGLPGVRPTEMTNMLAPNGLGHLRKAVDQRVSLDVLRAVTDISVTPLVPDFQTVSFAEHEAAIICHPLIEGTSAAAVSAAIASGTVRVSARARIDHPEGQPAAVGLVLAPSTADLRAEVGKLGSNGSLSHPLLFSGWREVTPEQPININVLLDEPSSESMDLIIVSRAVQASVDFCWLKVFDLRLVRDCGVSA